MKIKKTALLLTIICSASLCFAFDWPQEILGEDFAAYFGQYRGNTINPSLIFKEKTTIKAASKGKTAAIIGSHSQEMGWFPSTLGDAILISHDNNLISVYANMDKTSIKNATKTSAPISDGETIGTSGNSAWQTKENGLEFQVIDTKNKATINPRLLMPRLAAEQPYFIGNVTIDDRKNNSYNLITVKSLTAGTYSFYREKDELNVPYKATITINGEELHALQFDSLSTSNGRLCLGGSPLLTAERLYPDPKRQLIGTVNLLRGRNLVIITLTNILGETRTASYAFDVN